MLINMNVMFLPIHQNRSISVSCSQIKFLIVLAIPLAALIFLRMHRKYNGSAFLSKLNNFAKRYSNLGQIGKWHACQPSIEIYIGMYILCVCVCIPDTCIVNVLFICQWNNFVYCLFWLSHICVLLPKSM